ncbi:MAG TPA: GNAT family N-acetyltransferase [Candidatus Omnitrophota bacterium]|nr:GNAT family N-acetyltransferase [Candidatus Omnitrophota bacterium]
MPDGEDRLSVAVTTGIDAIDPADWDALAGTGNPFVAHAFLAALERSGSATADTGWLPRHLVVRDEAGKVAAAAPLYLKNHSYGEYVFDWGWAEAYQRAGGRYYPKLQCAIPFTPVTGPRLLGEARLRPVLAAGMVELARQWGVSSVHVTFPTEAEADTLEAAGFLRRLGFQYHWRNQGYRCFDDFLAALSSRKRKQIRKERAAIAAQDLTIATLVGADVKARHWDAFHRFHSQVVDRKWGSPYLTRAFFDELSASSLGERVVLVWVEQDGRPLAAAFNMLGGDILYGRTWGTRAELPFLHFEACYYRALDFAIAHGLQRVEAGAQGEHKVSRGYLPVATHSAHWIADGALRGPVSRFLVHERLMLAEEMAEQAEAGPFRRA